MLRENHMFSPRDSAHSSTSVTEDTGAFLGAVTIFKPNFRIVVAPRTGQLAVEVAPVDVREAPLKDTRASRH